MRIDYHKEWSHSLGRDMEYKVYGESQDVLCWLFPVRTDVSMIMRTLVWWMFFRLG